MKITKFFTLFLLFLTITIVLSGCNKDVEHKKNISIKDIINDKKQHMFFSMSTDEDNNNEIESIYLTKNGQMKKIFLGSSEISPSFLLNLDPNEVKKVLDNKKIDYQETPYKDVKTYLEVTNEKGNALITFVTTKDISEKKAKKGIGDVLKSVYSNDKQTEGLLLYTNVSTGSIQSAGDAGKYTGQLTNDNLPSLMNESNDESDRLDTIIKLNNKDQKMVNVSSQDKDVIKIKLSDFDTKLDQN